jgi:hypothetical protein
LDLTFKTEQQKQNSTKLKGNEKKKIAPSALLSSSDVTPQPW